MKVSLPKGLTSQNGKSDFAGQNILESVANWSKKRSGMQELQLGEFTTKNMNDYPTVPLITP
jgi:hypothetical protein